MCAFGGAGVPFCLLEEESEAQAERVETTFNNLVKAIVERLKQHIFHCTTRDNFDLE